MITRGSRVRVIAGPLHHGAVGQVTHLDGDEQGRYSCGESDEVWVEWDEPERYTPRLRPCWCMVEWLEEITK